MSSSTPRCLHRLERIDQKKYKYRWHCVQCDKFFRISTGIIIRQKEGPVTMADNTWHQTMARLARWAILCWLSDIYANATTIQMTLDSRGRLGEIITQLERAGR